MNKLLSISFFICFALSAITGCSQTSKQSDAETPEGSKQVHEILDLETYLSQLKAESRPHHFVDVRTPEEVADGTIDGSINVDFKAADFKTKIKALDNKMPIYLFCRSGNRSGKAANILIDAGYEEIYDLKGGYLKYAQGKSK